ncbi:MAG TPA: HupE/UreJ family protein [Humisphaera sp.]|jgi:hydrogenase/urease accessory protein HupE|nr:HupE/UreJ family protein [Humisphaera sp.]
MFTRSGTLILFLLALACGNAGAHPLYQGRLDVTIFADHIGVVAHVTQEEVAATNTATTPGAPPGPWAGTGSSAYEQHAAYFASHLHVFADGKELPAGVASITQPDDPMKSTAQAKYDLIYPLPAGLHPTRVELREDLLSDVHFPPGGGFAVSYAVNIGFAGTSSAEPFLLDADTPVQFDRFAKARVFRDYFVEGVKHILTGYDHLLFITALVLAATSLWDLVKVVTAFTLAHTMTLTLAALHLVTVGPRIVEPLISLSIVFVAMQNVFWPKTSRGVVRLAAAFFFGLFHGLGFAGPLVNVMHEMHGLTIATAIIAFSIGVEAGHQLVVIPLFTALKLIRHTRADAPAKERFSMAAQRFGSAAISLAGLFYLFVALRPVFGGTP